MVEILSLFVATGALIFAGFQTKYALESLRDDREERRQQRKRDRGAIITALRMEADSVSHSVNFDLQAFSNSRAWQGSGEGETGYKRSFVWTPLPMSSVEQASREAYLLDPTEEQLRTLRDFRLLLLKVNNLVAAKIAVLSTLVQGDVRRDSQTDYHRWAGIKADNLNLAIAAHLPEVASACGRITQQFKTNT